MQGTPCHIVTSLQPIEVMKTLLYVVTKFQYTIHVRTSLYYVVCDKNPKTEYGLETFRKTTKLNCKHASKIYTWHGKHLQDSMILCY